MPPGKRMSYKLIERQVIFDGTKCRLELHHLENEETGKRHRREVVVHPGAVVILGLLDDDKVILIRTRRYAVGQTLIELPAGTLEKGEDPMNCAGANCWKKPAISRAGWNGCQFFTPLRES